MMRTWTVIPFLLVSTLIQSSCLSKSIPESGNQDIRTFGHPRPQQQNGLNPTSKVLIWNIQKGQEESFEKDFYQLSDGKDLILLQEFLDNVSVVRAVLAQGTHEYQLGVSFIFDDMVPQAATGVAIGSVAPPVTQMVFRPPGREPFIGTPKVTLCNTFLITGKARQLLVCNIHGYNFTADEDFEKQIDMITPLLQEHPGPILFGGDFNTNNENKWAILEQRLIQESGLTPVVFSPDNRKTANAWLFWQADLPIDHIFTKGVAVSNSRVWKEIKGSDHDALSLTITIED